MRTMSIERSTRRLDPAEIVTLVEPSGKRILEVGCGDGALGRALLAAGATQVVGLEPDLGAANEARHGLTAVFASDLDAIANLPYPDGYFDVVTLVNVLEHTKNPEAVVTSLRRYVRDDGQLICVVPNIRHENIVLPLLFIGSFDRDTTRYFTRYEMEKILSAGGFEVAQPMAAERTEPSKVLPVITDLVAASGGNAQLFAEEATTVQLAFDARPKGSHATAKDDLPNLWVTAKTPERLLFLAGGNPDWENALSIVVRKYAKTGTATLGIPLSAKDLGAPPAAMVKIIGDDVDAVLMESPASDDAWKRLTAGATGIVIGKNQTALRNLAKTVGVPTFETITTRPSPAPLFTSPIKEADDKKRYIDLMKRILTNVIYSDSDLQFDTAYDLDQRAGGLDWPENAHTMVGIKRLDNLQMLIEDVIARKVPGDLIETGVWRGGATILMRAILAAHGVRDRRVWVADSFEGLPPPNPDLYPADAGDKHFTKKELAVSIEDVKHHFDVYGLLDDQVKFLKGWFKDTLHVAPIDKLAVVRLDGDMYESTMDGIRPLYPKLSVGGYLIVDDFHAVAACRRAIEDYRREFGITDEIKPIDKLAVYWQKTK